MARDTTPDSDDSLPVDPRLRELETLNSPSRTDSAGTSQTSQSDNSPAESSRGNLIRPERRAKRKSDNTETETEVRVKALFAQIEMAVRLSHLIYFNDIFADRILDQYAPNPDKDAEVTAIREKAYQKITTNMSNWKTRTIVQFKVHVRKVVKANPHVAHIKEFAALTEHFYGIANIESLSELFVFCTNKISIARSSQRGQVFARNIYAMLASKIKLHIDWIDHNGPANHDDNVKGVHHFYTNMALSDEFNNVVPSDFKVTGRSEPKKQKTSKTSKDKPTVVIRDVEKLGSTCPDTL